MRRFLVMWVAICLLVGTMATAALADEEQVRYAKVATEKGTLNMRADAKDSAKILKKLAKGTIVSITEDGDDWTKILYKGTVGYVMTRYIEEITELPYAPITKDSDGNAVMAFKKLMYKLGYLKSEEINKKFDKAMEKALTKLQLMNDVALDPEAVTPELQALMEWGMLVKAKSGYLDTETDEETGLKVAIYCWDIAGTLYEEDKSVKLKIAYGVQAAGGQPPYTITVKKSIGAGGAEFGDEVANPFSHIWSPSTDCIYVYATAVDAAGNTVTACTPFRYTLPSQYTDSSGG